MAATQRQGGEAGGKHANETSEGGADRMEGRREEEAKREPVQSRTTVQI